jgi:hypothetical protein
MFGVKTRLKKMYARMTGTRRACRVLCEEYGLGQSMYTNTCIDKAGNCLPWLTYPAIEYIKQLDLSDKTVFEYGSGYSTLFWANRCKRVVSVEDDNSWYERMSLKIPKNVDYILAKTEDDYVNAIEGRAEKFDVIVNDGIYRLRCAATSTPKLAHDGFIILDNSEWCVKTAAFYRDAGLIEVDMAGFGPINDYPWMTSFFLTRQVSLKPAGKVQPAPGPGMVMWSEEKINEWVKG